MNGLELLKDDHRKVQGFFKQVRGTDNERQHKKLYKKIKNEVETHT